MSADRITNRRSREAKCLLDESRGCFCFLHGGPRCFVMWNDLSSSTMRDKKTKHLLVEIRGTWSSRGRESFNAFDPDLDGRCVNAVALLILASGCGLYDIVIRYVCLESNEKCELGNTYTDTRFYRHEEETSKDYRFKKISRAVRTLELVKYRNRPSNIKFVECKNRQI